MSRLDEITGPVDIVLIRFPGNSFTGEIAPALAEVVENGIVRILDLVFVVKDAAGDVAAHRALRARRRGVGLRRHRRRDRRAAHRGGPRLRRRDALEPNSSALMILFENTWASHLTTALRNADGEVVAFERIPRENLEAALADIDA